MRVGWGFDAHRFGGPGPVRLCGVDIDAPNGLAGTSDADAAIHAVIDAALGAAALGDIGEMFPSADPQWENADSAALLAAALERVHAAGYRVDAVDVTIVAQIPRIAPHRPAMRSVLSRLLGIEQERVSVKATSTDGMGAIGRGEGIAAHAVVTLAHP
jgi:2-C-methyl-D-erythritol 2,4-cyclodiphosphate synthase